MTTGNSKGPTKIPNLYEVLNLQPKECDDQAIRSALRLYAEQVKKMQPGEPAQAAAKLFAIAKQNLLDPVKKSAYDSLWDKVFGASPSAQPKQSVASPAQESSSVEKKKERSNASVVSAITQSVEKVVSAAQSTESQATRPQVQPAQTAQLSEATQPALLTQEPTQEPSWDLTELEAILPSGDPSAPLDLSAFLESTELNADGQRTMEDLDRDFQKLLSLLGVEVQRDILASDVATTSASASATTAGSSSSLFDFDSTTTARPANTTNMVQTPSLGIGGSTGALPPVVAATRQASNARSVPPSKVRKKRDRSLLMMVSGGLTVLLTVLGVLLVMLKRSNEQRNLAAGPPPAVAAHTAEPTTNKTPKSSGLPKAGSGLPQPGSGLPKPGGKMGDGGNDAAMLLDPTMQAEAPAMPQATNPPANTTPAMQPATPPTTTPPTTDPTPPKPSENPTEPAKPDTSKPDTSKPDTAKTDMANAESKPATGTTTDPSTEKPMAEEVKVELTAQEKATWKKQMRQARNLLGERQYEEAKELLGKIEQNAKSGQQKAQLRRLSTVADFAEQFNSAMMSALEGMGASETITVGNSEIAFVESSEDKLVVKMASGIKRYPWKDVPINLAYGYADLKLDQGPKSAAAKASFAAVHTKMNPAAIENARKLMQSAAAAEVVPADTHEVFDDDYALE